MELSELNKRAIRLVDGDFDGLKIVVNANAATGRYMREAAERMTAFENDSVEQPETARPKGKRKRAGGMTVLDLFQGRGAEVERECALLAALVKGSDENPYLMSWDLEHNGKPIECCEAELRKLHPQLLRGLWYACGAACRPKSPETRTTATNRTISDNTVATTPIPDTRTDASPIM